MTAIRRFITRTTAATSPRTTRLLPIDALRGLIIVVMALDHANHFIAHGKLEAELWSGAYPDYAGDALAFITRLVTHLAAPGFFFLMGAGMLLFTESRREKDWSFRQIATHFALRGALLIVLQLLVENFAWTIGTIGQQATYFGVLYALGAAMICGIPLLYLPTWALVTLGVGLIGVTELLLPASNINQPALLRLWLAPGFSPGMYVLYPVMPWLGVLALGMAFGRWLKADVQAVYRGALIGGVVCLVGFVIIRALNGFGNIRPIQTNDWIGFLNVVKYPPVITFLLLTLGTNGILLWLLSRLSTMNEALLQPLVIFGRVPLFFYILHLYLYGIMGQIINPNGTGIPPMYIWWMLGLVILLPMCWIYGQFKHSRPPNSLWRFL